MVEAKGDVVRMCRCVICTTSSTLASSKNVVVLCRECTINFLIAERAMLRARKEMLSQCAKCGLILNGNFKGLLFLQEDSKPNREAGESHGLCGSCSDKTLSDWRDIKRMRLAVVL